MKKKILLLAMMLGVMASCTAEMEDSLNFPDETVSTQEGPLVTRALNCDSLELGDLVPLAPSEEMLRLKKLYNEALLSKSGLRAVDDGIKSEPSYDDFFDLNIYAIRELPITIKVRSVASGSSSSNCYFKCEGAGKEVTLSNSSTSAYSRFYLRILPSVSGVPYLIYSNVSRTPLCVGHYTNNPDNKILMSASSDTGTSFGASWDLLPSPSYNGYFAIESEDYVGQLDPNSPWFTFLHVLEAMPNNKIGYAQRVENKAQQEFLISTVNPFELQSVEYDLSNATITSGDYVTKVTSLTNELEIPNTVPVNVNVTANETSYYSETKGTLSLNITSPTTLKFPRPIPIAGQAVLTDDIIPDATYGGTTQNISKTVEYVTEIEMKPKSLLQLTTKFKTFILNVPYVATATYNDREVKVRGTWRGYAIANPEYYAPINEPRFFDLETRGELNYTMEFDEVRNLYIVK